MQITATQWVAALLFAGAIAHTFCTGFFERMAQWRPAHAGLWHLLGEIEVVFGFWALLLALALLALQGAQATTQYLDSRNYTEPMFVFAVMVISGTRPVLRVAMVAARALAQRLALAGCVGHVLVVLSLVPLLGSLITEPAAMTLAALMLAEPVFSRTVSRRLRYATLGVLFVNISIGGTLTAYAAPPVLMVAHAWGWDSLHLMRILGWKAALAVAFNALALVLLFRRELAALPAPQATRLEVPVPLVLAHLGFLAAVVVFAHHPAIFMGLFLFFLGLTQAYPQHQSPLILREGLLVAFFLAGLVVLGGLQSWWLAPLLLNLSSQAVFWGAVALTAVTDNAALTYLGAQVPGLSAAFQYALVAGAVTGGGLTLIANAPNPAGAAVLRRYFPDQTIQPLPLLWAALPPTAVAALAFLL